MVSQVFYRKWRPQTLADVVGQEQVTKTLLNALGGSRISHAYLFCGPRGTGKTSTGRILAKAVNCLTNEGKGEPCNTCAMCQAITEGRALDVIEVDAASNRGIDEIRDLREKVTYAPNQARYKVYIIDEVHMLTKEASNALLKTLEEPPPHVIFVLATTEAHKVLATILSRCQRFDFRRISQAEVAAKLGQICDTEGIKIDTEALNLIARAATGSLRDAENLLQQLTTYYGNEITLSQVQTILGISGDWRVKELARHIINNDIASGIATVNSVNSDGLDLRQFNRELVEYLRALLLVKTGSNGAIDITGEDMAELKGLAGQTSLGQILRAVKLFGQLDIGQEHQPTLPLEMALVECSMPTVEVREEPVSAVPTEATAPKEKPAKASTAAGKTTAPVKAEPDAEVKSEPVATKAEDEPSPPPPAPKTKPSNEQPVTAAPAPVSGNEIELLRLNWRQAIVNAPEGLGRTPAAALLRSARPKAIEDGVLVISFRYPMHKDNMEKIDNQKTAEKIISAFLGHDCRVRCVCEPERDHLVQEALKMGAQIIDGEEP